MPLDPELRRQIDLQVLRDFAAELEASLASGTLDLVGVQSAEYHLGLARQGIQVLSQPPAPPVPGRRPNRHGCTHRCTEGRPCGGCGCAGCGYSYSPPAP